MRLSRWRTVRQHFNKGSKSRLFPRPAEKPEVPSRAMPEAYCDLDTAAETSKTYALSNNEDAVLSTRITEKKTPTNKQTHTHINDQLIFNRNAKAIPWKKDNLFNT